MSDGFSGATATNEAPAGAQSGQRQARRSMKEWKTIIAGQKSSGEPIDAYCAKIGIPTKNFHAAVSRIKSAKIKATSLAPAIAGATAGAIGAPTAAGTIAGEGGLTLSAGSNKTFEGLGAGLIPDFAIRYQTPAGGTLTLAARNNFDESALRRALGVVRETILS